MGPDPGAKAPASRPPFSAFLFWQLVRLSITRRRRAAGRGTGIPCADKDLFSTGMRHFLQFREFLGSGVLGYIQAVFISSAVSDWAAAAKSDFAGLQPRRRFAGVVASFSQCTM